MFIQGQTLIGFTPKTLCQTLAKIYKVDKGDNHIPSSIQQVNLQYDKQAPYNLIPQHHSQKFIK